MIRLGDEAVDTVSGFKGIAISSTRYLQGCERVGLQPKVKKDGILQEPSYFDEPQLKVTKRNGVKNKDNTSGGVAYAIPTMKGIGKR